MDSPPNPIVGGSTYLGLEAAAPERVFLHSGVVHALNAAEEAAAVTERLSGISASFARRLQGSLDELDQGPPLERLFQESDRAAL
jgi:hypothetical protein